METLILAIRYNMTTCEREQFFTKFHALYTDAICNPFYNVGDSIVSKSFEKKLATLASTNL